MTPEPRALTDHPCSDRRCDECWAQPRELIRLSGWCPLIACARSGPVPGLHDHWCAPGSTLAATGTAVDVGWQTPEGLVTRSALDRGDWSWPEGQRPVRGARLAPSRPDGSPRPAPRRRNLLGVLRGGLRRWRG